MVDEVAGDTFCRLGGGPETSSSGLELAILGLAILPLQIFTQKQKTLRSHDSKA
jgi:hypothetical protein